MTDGTNVIDLRRRAAQYLNKILRGGQPADLLIEQPTKFELVINLICHLSATAMHRTPRARTPL
jgi:ABC-type uncharacterized transport system substrate-binding protein